MPRHFRPSLRDLSENRGSFRRPSSELLGYYRLSLRDKLRIMGDYTDEKYQARHRARQHEWRTIQNVHRLR